MVYKTVRNLILTTIVILSQCISTEQWGFFNLFGGGGGDKPNTSKWKTLDGKPTLIFGHRGERILLPPHTLPGYEIAALEMADYVEPDLVLTKDDILVCFHDIFLNDGTDVKNHPEFDHLRKDYSGLVGFDQLDIVNGYFIQDFTLAELKTLRVVQSPVGIRPQDFNGLFQIPTFQEFLDLMQKMNVELGKKIGIIPELKKPSHHNDKREPYHMENIFLSVLKQNGYTSKSDEAKMCQSLTSKNGQSLQTGCHNLIIQCFEEKTLEYIRTKSDFDLLLLVDTQLNYLTYGGLRKVATQVQYIGIWKEVLVTDVKTEAAFNYDEKAVESLGGFIPPEKFTAEAHRLGLRVAIYTVKDSREGSDRGCAIVPGCMPGNKTQEMFSYFDLGVDGMFVENISESILILQKYQSQLK